jgi:hypothetical protein
MKVVTSILAWLSRPTWPAFVAMIVTASGIVLAAALIDDVTLYRWLPDQQSTLYWGNDNFRLYKRLHDFLSIKHDGDRLRVVVIGGSTTRDSVWSERQLSSDIARLGGGMVDIVNMSSSGQKLLQSWALTELAACHGGDVIVLGANTFRLARSDTVDPYLAIGHVAPEVTAYLMRDATRGAMTIGSSLDQAFKRSGFVMNMVFQLSAAHVRVWLGWQPDLLRLLPEYWEHPWLASPTANQQRAGVQSAERFFANGPPLDYPLLERIRATAQRCGARLVLMATAVHPDLLDPRQSPAFSRTYAGNNDKLRSLSTDVAKPIVLNQLVDYSRSDFLDWGHLKTEHAMKASTRAMAQALIPVLQEMRP